MYRCSCTSTPRRSHPKCSTRRVLSVARRTFHVQVLVRIYAEAEADSTLLLLQEEAARAKQQQQGDKENRRSSLGAKGKGKARGGLAPAAGHVGNRSALTPCRGRQ